MTVYEHSFRRNAIGLLALGFLVAAAVLTPLRHEAAGYMHGWNTCFHLGVVLCAWWLAYPEARRLPGWLWLAIPALLLLLVMGPKGIPWRWLMVVGIPIVVLLVLLKPRRR
jgi:hypothetical protein